MNWTPEELALKGYGLDGKKIKTGARNATKTEEAESRLQSNCEKYLQGEGIYYIHLHNARGNRPGIPDLIICLDGHFVGVELKTKTKLKPEQALEARKIKASGGSWELITTLRDFKNYIESLRANLRAQRKDR